MFKVFSTWGKINCKDCLYLDGKIVLTIDLIFSSNLSSINCVTIGAYLPQMTQ